MIGFEAARKNENDRAFPTVSRSPSSVAPPAASPAGRITRATPTKATARAPSRRTVGRSRPARTANRSVSAGMLVLISEEWVGVVRDSPSMNSTWLSTTPKIDSAASCPRIRGELGSRLPASRAISRSVAAPPVTRISASACGVTSVSAILAAR